MAGTNDCRWNFMEKNEGDTYKPKKEENCSKWSMVALCMKLCSVKFLAKGCAL